MKPKNPPLTYAELSHDYHRDFHSIFGLSIEMQALFQWFLGRYDIRRKDYES